MALTITSTGNHAIYISEGDWQGGKVQVESSRHCNVPGHALYVMHHHGNPDGKDYGPTGFLMCAACDGIADDPDVEITECPRCRSWNLDDIQQEDGSFRFRCHRCGQVWSEPDGAETEG